MIVVVVARICLPVTGQRQTLTIGRVRTFFIAMTTSCLDESAHLLNSFQRSNVPLDVFQILVH